MGSSVKFVSAIKDAIYKKKWGSIFFLGKKTIRGGGGGGDGKRPYFSLFIFLNPSLTNATKGNSCNNQTNIKT